jgi:hypothetical protein
MKEITLKLSDQAFRRLRSMVWDAWLAGQESPLAAFANRIVEDLEEGNEVCELWTADERAVGRML